MVIRIPLTSETKLGRLLPRGSFEKKIINLKDILYVLATNLNVGTGKPCVGHVRAIVEFDLYSITSYLDFDDTFGNVLLIGSKERKNITIYLIDGTG